MICTLQKYIRVARHQVAHYVHKLHQYETAAHAVYFGLVAAGGGYRVIAGGLCVAVVLQLVAQFEGGE